MNPHSHPPTQPHFLVCSRFHFTDPCRESVTLHCVRVSDPVLGSYIFLSESRTESMVLARVLCTEQALLHLAHASSVSLEPTRRGRVSHQRDDMGGMCADAASRCTLRRWSKRVSELCGDVTRQDAVCSLMVRCDQHEPSPHPSSCRHSRHCPPGLHLFISLMFRYLDL